MEEKLRLNPNLLITQSAPAPTTTSAAPVQIPILSPQQNPANPTDMVNEAVAAGIKQGQRENAIQQIDNEAANVANQVQETGKFMGLPLQQAYDLGNLSNTRFAQSEILKATQGYNQAQAAGDTEGMAYYNDRANAIRDWSNAKGIDMSAYGSDRTLAQKQAAFDMSNQDRYAEMLNTKDSGNFYNERFDYYKEAGLSDRGAHKRAYDDAQAYRTKRLRTLQDEFFANAINPQTGAIGNYGVQLLGMMRDEDPDSITPIVTMMPGPMQDYVVRMSEYQKGNAFDRSLQAADNQFEHQRTLNRDNQTFQSEQMDKQIAAKERMQSKDLNMKLVLASMQAGKKKADGNGLWEGELPADELKKLYELKEQWAMANPNADPATNPYNDVINTSEQKTKDRLNNNYIISPNEIKDYKDAYHNAAVVMDWVMDGRLHRDDGQPVTMDDVAQYLEKVCGSYAPQIIEEWTNNPNIRAIIQ